MLNRNKTTTAPTFGQWSLAGTFLGLSVAGSVGSLYINWTFGMEIDPIAAAIFGAAEVALFAIPFTKGSLGWNMRRRAIWAICLAMSLTAASFHLLEMFEQRTKDIQAISAKVASAKADETAARYALARIIESGDAKALQAEYDELKAKADREEGRGGCLKKCEAAKDAARALLPRIGAAKQRDELKASLTQAAQTVADTPERSFGGAGTLARLTGAGEAEIGAYRDMLAMSLIILCLVMLGSMSGDAGLMLTDCIARQKASRESRIAPKNFAPTVVASIAAQPGQVTVSQPKSVEEEMLITVQMLVMHSPGQQLRTSIRKLAEHLQVARATLQDWMMKWRDEGKIVYRSAGNETIFQLPKAA